MDKLSFGAIAVVVFMIPWEEMAQIPGMRTLIFVAAALAFGLSLLGIVFRLSVKRLPAAMVFLALFVAWSFLSLSWSLNDEQTWIRSTTYLYLFLFAWMIWEFADSPIRQQWLMVAYLLGCCVCMAMQITAFALGTARGFRITGGEANVNNLATMLAIGIAMAAYLAARTSAKHKLLRNIYWAFIPTAGLSIFLTGSRGGVVALAIVVVMTMWAMRLGGWKAIVLFLLVVGAGAYYVPRILPSDLKERVTSTEVGTLAVRFNLWNAGITVWSERPLIGVGSGAFITATEGIANRPGVAHNTCIAILTENGAIGLALKLGAWSLLLLGVWAMPRQERLLWLTAFAVWAAVSLKGDLQTLKITWLLYAMIMAQARSLQAIHGKVPRVSAMYRRMVPVKPRYPEGFPP